MVDSVGIESIEKTGEKQVVYDLDDVEPDHLYLVEDGLVAHNCMDEFSEAQKKKEENFRPGQEEDIIETFSDVSRRMESRFQEMGHTAGKLFLVSSKKDENAPLEGYIEDLKDKGIDDSVLIINRPIWEVKPWEYTSRPKPKEEPDPVIEWDPDHPDEETVPLCKGSVNELPQLIEDSEELKQHKEAGHEIIHIPKDEEIIRSFKRNPIKAFRDFIGEDPASDRKRNFLPRPQVLDSQISTKLPNLFGDGIIELGEQYKNRPLEEFFEPHKALNKGAPRALHVDLSESQNSTGISMVHYIPLESIDRSVPGREKMFMTDFCLEIKPFSGDKIPIPNIRHFIYQLIVEFSFNVQRVTFDGFQSTSTMQELRMSDRIDTDQVTIELLSVDENRGPYDLLRGVIRDGSIILLNHKTLKSELKDLINTDGKWDHPTGGCFTGDTMIPTLGDGHRSISELVEEGEFWVHSIDENGVPVPAKAEARETKEVDELIELVLSNGSVVRCTKDHRFMLRDGSYKEAQDIVVNRDRLMPIELGHTKRGYVRISSPNLDRERRARWVMDSLDDVDFNLEDNCVVHHENGEKTCDVPSNLEFLEREKHSRSHTKERHENEDDYTESTLNAMRQVTKTEEWSENQSEVMEEVNKEMTEEDYVQRARSRDQFRDDVTFDAVKELVQKDKSLINPYRVGKEFDCDRKVIIRVIQDRGYSDFDEFYNDVASGNHTVRQKRVVSLEESVSVFDLEVPKFSNFLLSAGVVVHNSKDVSDSLSGAVWNASKIDASGQMASGEVMQAMVEEMKKNELREGIDEPIEEQLSAKKVAEEQGKEFEPDDDEPIEDKSDVGQIKTMLDDLNKTRS